MARQVVSVEGLDEFIRATARVNKKAAGFVRKELRVGVGGAFVKDVKSTIDAAGLVGQSKKLRGSIRPAVKGSTLLVRSTPPLKPGKRSPMGYAAVYEYGGRSGRRAARPYLNPTLDEWIGSGRLVEAFNGALDNVEREYAA